MGLTLEKIEELVKSFRSFSSTGQTHAPPRRHDRPHPDKKPRNLTSEKIDELVSQYRIALGNPDHTLVTAKQAARRFNINEADLLRLSSSSCLKKENPYGLEAKEFRQYWLPDVVRLAKDTHGEENLVSRYRKYLESGQREEETYRKVYGWSKLRKQMMQEKEGTAPTESRSNRFVASMSLRGSVGEQPHGMQAVKQSLYTNVGICGTKLCVWLMTGSAAMYSDLMHSAADVLNALFRYHGIRKSEGGPDAHHPYGQERRRFVFADRSACTVLVLGGALPLFHCWHDINVAHELVMPGATIAVFCISALLESLQVRKAFAELQTQAREKDMTVWQYYKSGSEMMSISTFTEASVGMLGAVIGVVGVVAAACLDSVFYDSLSGMLIAGCVCLAAGSILFKNERQLLGCTLPIDVVVRITERLMDSEAVTSVHDVKTEVYGTKAVRYKAEIQFNAEAITRRCRGLGRIPSPEAEALAMELKALSANPDPIELQTLAEDWVMRNNAQFLSNLCDELKALETIVREELQRLGYVGIHVDLEPW
jgi:zinc transporter 9